jgi:putative ABC transport system ATP-binding protein/lipoprotein-releasing system ATP-binding protein
MIVAKNIIKEFGSPAQRILHDLSFEIASGEFVSISGRSGSGKSTLLYIISSLDHPTSGKLLIDGEDIASMNSERIHAFRNHNIGFIFQFHYLLPELTALENILLPPRNLNRQNEYLKRAKDLLEMFNATNVMHKLPGQMSGGEQQRVAIARALIMTPKYIFADEPTGNLDTVNSQIVMKILKEINQNSGTTICLVTHEPDYAAMASREIYLIDGKIATNPL